MAIKVIYNPARGVVVSDANLHEWVKKRIQWYKTDLKKSKWCRENGSTVSVASELLVEAFRIAVVRKLISHKEIVFVFKDEEIKINEKGVLSHYPSGFLDTHTSLLFELI